MDIHKKAAVLIEALPYIKKYYGKIVVIKAGGNALGKKDGMMEDIVLLKHIGINPVVVHGAGPEIDKELEKEGIKAKFIDGLRYTDKKVIGPVKKAFSRVSREMIGNISLHNAKAVNLSGCIKAKQKHEKYGLVGEVTGIDKKKILDAVGKGFIPVISPLGVGNGKGRSKEYNINADTAASHIAVALNAEKLTIVTNVDGIVIRGKLQSHVDFSTAMNEIKSGIISKGMIPKVKACMHAVKNKCPKAHLINGLIPHSLLLEIFTDKGIGTEIIYHNGLTK